MQCQVFFLSYAFPENAGGILLPHVFYMEGKQMQTNSAKATNKAWSKVPRRFTCQVMLELNRYH